MPFWFTRNRKSAPVESPSAVQVSLEDVKRALLQYETEMPEGINRLALMQTDGSIDMNRLTRYLGGITEQRFFLSRETYEVFTEDDREIPYFLDRVQAAVDNYVDEKGKLPVLQHSSQYEVDFRLLLREHYLNELPPFPLYVTEQELMLTHRPKHSL